MAFAASRFQMASAEPRPAMPAISLALALKAARAVAPSFIEIPTTVALINAINSTPIGNSTRSIKLRRTTPSGVQESTCMT